MPSELESVRRNSSIRPSEALREMAGRVAEAMATPNKPSGSCMNRKAYPSQATGPSGPRHRIRDAGGEIRADQDVDLHGRIAQDGGTHQPEDLLQAGVRPVGLEAEDEPGTIEARQLPDELQ